MDNHNPGPVSVDNNIPQSTKEQNNRKKRNVRNISQIVFSDYPIKNDSSKKNIRKPREPLEGELICVPCENDLLWQYKTQGDKEQDFDNTSNTSNDFHV